MPSPLPSPLSLTPTPTPHPRTHAHARRYSKEANVGPGRGGRRRGAPPPVLPPPSVPHVYGMHYDRSPWTDDDRDSVSLEMDGDTPWAPTPGDSGLGGALYVEAENFTVVTPPGQPKGATPPFVVTEWGRDHYYGATFENTFAHSKALLHSTNQSIGAAKGSISIPTSATYYVCVRYEAAYRFETEFTVTISGAGTFKQIYGRSKPPPLSNR